MTQQHFISEIREKYLKARECMFTPQNSFNKLRRGTSHSISSITEDLFGCYCAEKVKKKSKSVRIFIDPPISFKGTNLKNKSGKKSLLMRPDLASGQNH